MCICPEFIQEEQPSEACPPGACEDGAPKDPEATCFCEPPPDTNVRCSRDKCPFRMERNQTDCSCPEPPRVECGSDSKNGQGKKSSNARYSSQNATENCLIESEETNRCGSQICNLTVSDKEYIQQNRSDLMEYEVASIEVCTDAN